MPRINLQAVPRPKRSVETRTFADRNHPDLPIELTLRAPDAYDITRMATKAQAMIDGLNGNHLPLANGEAVEVSLEIAQMVCGLAVCQPETVEDPYAPEDFIGLMVNFPDAWRQVLEWSAELATTGEHHAGNSPADGTEAGSAPS